MTRRTTISLVSVVVSAELVAACVRVAPVTGHESAQRSPGSGGPAATGRCSPSGYVELSNVATFVDGPGDGKGKAAHPDGEGACARRGDGSVYCWHGRAGRIAKVYGDDHVLAELQTSPPAPRERSPSRWGGGETNGECEQDAKGRVRCRGNKYLSLGMGHAYPDSDASWRDIPDLQGATFIGTDEYCAWGIAPSGVVVQDCVSAAQSASVVCYSRGGACIRSRRSSYHMLESTIERAISWYRFPRPLHKLVEASVGLADDGRLFAIERQSAVEWDGLYRDVVLDEIRDEHILMLYGLTVDGQISVIVFDGATDHRWTVPVVVRSEQDAPGPNGCNG